MPDSGTPFAHGTEAITAPSVPVGTGCIPHCPLTSESTNDSIRGFPCAPPGSVRRPRPLNLEALEDRTVPAPAVLDPNLGIRTAVSGLALPTSLAFIGDNDFFVLEKNSGKVQHVINGVIAGAALDLPVNNNSERGLLGMALSPNFANDQLVYLYWTQSSTGADSGVVSEVDLDARRVLHGEAEKRRRQPIVRHWATSAA